MDQMLIQFINALRSQNIRIGTSESLDAMRAVNAVGYASRSILKQALCCSLIKSQSDLARFELTFARFFSFEDWQQPDNRKTADTTENIDTTESITVQPESPLAQLLLQGDAGAMAAAMANAADKAQTRHIRVITQKGHFSRRMLSALGQEQLDQEIWAAEKSDETARQSHAHRLREARETLRLRVRDHVERQYLLYAQGEGQAVREAVMLDTPMINLLDQKGMQALIRKLAKRLAALHARRRKVFQRGKLDVRTTLRRNIPYGGVLLETHWKTRLIDRPRIMVICDVSGSVRQYALFLLTFLYHLSDVLSKVRAFAFSHDLEEVTQLFQSQSIEQAIPQTLQRLGRGSTDYGRSLNTFVSQYLPDVDHRTTVIMLGDARNNYGDSGIIALQAIQNRCKQIIWLNPEHKRQWGQGDSEMLHYQTCCHWVQHCATLSQLERFISNLLRFAQ